MPPVGFEPMTPVFERAKTVHALDLRANKCILYYTITLLNLSNRCVNSLSGTLPRDRKPNGTKLYNWPATTGIG
jgi:hypothetical protein